jgi:hypothetical protein
MGYPRGKCVRGCMSNMLTTESLLHENRIISIHAARVRDRLLSSAFGHVGL